MTREEIESWVKEALASKDQVYQLVEVCRTVAELERARCAQQADEKMSYSIPGSKDFDLGWKRSAEAIARNIRLLTL